MKRNQLTIWLAFIVPALFILILIIMATYTPKEPTRADYTEHLNELSPSWDSDEWIIGGKDRRKHYYPKRWGVAVRRFDTTAFNSGYNDYLREYRYRKNRKQIKVYPEE